MTNKELVKIIDQAVERAEKRFDKRLKESLNQRFAEQDKKFDQRFAEQEKRFDEKLKKRDAKFEKKLDHYVGAVVEDSKHNVSAVAEQYTSLVHKIDELNEKADLAIEDRQRIKIELYAVKQVADATFEEVGAMRVEITESNEKLHNHEERITVLEAKVR